MPMSQPQNLQPETMSATGYWLERLVLLPERLERMRFCAHQARETQTLPLPDQASPMLARLIQFLPTQGLLVEPQ
jgi:hypothetical protein